MPTENLGWLEAKYVEMERSVSRLRELVRHAYEEGWDDGEQFTNDWMVRCWEKSKAKAALEVESSIIEKCKIEAKSLLSKLMYYLTTC